MDIQKAIDESYKRWSWHATSVLDRIIVDEFVAYIPQTHIRTLGLNTPEIVTDYIINEPTTIDIILKEITIKRDESCNYLNKLKTEIMINFVCCVLKNIYNKPDKIYLVRYGDNEFGHIQNENYKKYFFKFCDAYYDFLLLHQTLSSHGSRLKNSNIEYLYNNIEATNGIIKLELYEIKCN